MIRRPYLQVTEKKMYKYSFVWYNMKLIWRHSVVKLKIVSLYAVNICKHGRVIFLFPRLVFRLQKSEWINEKVKFEKKLNYMDTNAWQITYYLIYSRRISRYSQRSFLHLIFKFYEEDEIKVISFLEPMFFLIHKLSVFLLNE